MRLIKKLILAYREYKAVKRQAKDDILMIKKEEERWLEAYKHLGTLRLMFIELTPFIPEGMTEWFESEKKIEDIIYSPNKVKGKFIDKNGHERTECDCLVNIYYYVHLKFQETLAVLKHEYKRKNYETVHRLATDNFEKICDYLHYFGII